MKLFILKITLFVIASFMLGCNEVKETNNINELLVKAIEKENYTEIDKLLDLGADPNFHVEGVGSAMSLSTRCKTIKCMELLLQSGGDPNLYLQSTKRNLIFKTISPGKLEYVKLLVENGANLNAQDSVGNTPLIAAIILNQFEIAFYLLDSGADKSLKNNFGNTALDIFKTSKSNTKQVKLEKILLSSKNK